MKGLFAILRKGQACPSWLQRIESANGADATLTVGCLSVVYKAGGAYVWRPVLPLKRSECMLHIRCSNNGHDINVQGGSPAGSDEGVIMVARALIRPPWVRYDQGCAVMITC